MGLEEHDKENRNSKVPRELRTPITSANTAIEGVFHWYVELLEPHGVDSNEAAELFIEMLEDEWSNETISGDQAVEDLFIDGLANVEAGILNHGLFNLATIVIDYAIQAIESHKEGEIELAWTFAIDASHWLGLLEGTVAERESSDSVSSNARKAAQARHRPNREMAEKIKQWYIDSRDKHSSYDGAAAKAITKFPVAFRTARKHIGEIAKTHPLHAKSNTNK